MTRGCCACRDTSEGASGQVPDAKKMLDARSEQVAELTRELVLLCRKIEQTTQVALESINEPLDAAVGAEEGDEESESAAATTAAAQ